MKKQITLHTQLNSGIYKSCGGGQNVIVSSWNCGPANLLKALNALHEERQSNVRGYGNIGCGKSWLEIDGAFFDATALNDEVQYEQYIREDKNFHRAPLSKIEIAKKHIG